jgi:glycosyltransferase involved in cell wall biosynthesis
MGIPTSSAPPGSPTVSVIIPAYNTAEFITETLDSVFQQTFTNFEVIVVNDGSPDTGKLEAVLEPFRNRIVYLKQENRGLSGARNTAIRQARGEYLAFLDSDDMWLPRYLETQLNFLEKNPGVDAVYCDSLQFGDFRLTDQTFMEMCPSIGPVTLESVISCRCQVCVSATVARHKAVVHAGLFDEELRSVEDWDLWIRLIYRGGTIAYHKAVLGRRRLRPGSLSSASVSMLGYQMKILLKIDNAPDLSPTVRSLIRERLQLCEALSDLEQGKVFLADDRLSEAEASLRKANGFLRRKRLDYVLFGLRTFPNVTRLVTNAWYSLLKFFALGRAAVLFSGRVASGARNRQ